MESTILKSENLNLEYNVRILILKAMEKYKYEFDQAQALKISNRTLQKYKREFGLQRKQLKQAA
jgi:hypothetical protein